MAVCRFRSLFGHTLVTGSKGYIGSYITSRLGARGIDVGFRTLPQLFAGVADVRLLSSRDLVTHDIQMIIHAAGCGSSASDDELTQARSTTEHLLSIAQSAGVRTFVLLSSSRVYGHYDRPVTEADPCAPNTPYAASKYMEERAVRRAVALRRRLILRLGTVFGRSERPHWSGFVHDFVRQAVLEDAISLTTDGRARHSYLRLETLLNALAYAWVALRDNECLTFNLADGACTFRAWARLVARHYGISYRLGTEPSEGVVLDTSAFRRWARHSVPFKPLSAKDIQEIE